MFYNQIIKTIISTSIASLAYLFMGRIILNKKIQWNFKNILVIIVFVSVVAIIQLTYNSVVRTLPLFILTLFVFLSIFKENTYKTIITTFISYGTVIFGELLYAFLASLIFGKEFLNDTNLSQNIIINNIIISVISVLITAILRKKLKKIVKNVSDKHNIINTILCLLIILILSILIYKIYSNHFIIDQSFVINGILIIIAFVIGIYLFIQKLNINSVEQKYQKFVIYSREIEEMIEEYRVLQHEFKNELIIIREMLNNKNNPVKEYINSLLNEKNMSKYLWAQELKNIPLDGLKGFLNYKILQMIGLGIKIEVSVSKDIKKSKIINLDGNQKKQLYNIIGVYVDNAIEAAQESRKKRVSLDIYLEKESICFEIANTYKGKIELNKIDNPGFSTKEKGHGYGLALVKRILNSTNIFSQERNIVGDLYIQKFYIK